jgi:eukaryotic-like serine/threonine-protein kinase
VWRICSTCGVRTDDLSCPDGHGETGLICEDSQFPGRLQPKYMLKGQYRLGTLIGVGGMGVVYRAEHHLTNQNVAIKVLWRDLAGNPSEVKRFTREARAASVLAHPNSVRVYDFGKDEDTESIYMVMEFLGGRKLSDLLRDEPVLDPGRAVHIGAQVCKALEEAHSKGLIHRDLKPDNIFLQDVAGENDFVKVLDFGLAKFVSGDFERDNLTKTGYVVGSPEYMAPEQAIGSSVGPAVDIYALGVMMYEILTGDLPFDAETTAQVLRKHIMETPTPMHDLVDDDVPDALVDVVMRCLAKEPDDRPPSADALRIQMITAYDRRGRAARANATERQQDDAEAARAVFDTDEHTADERPPNEPSVMAPGAIGGSVHFPDGATHNVAAGVNDFADGSEDDTTQNPSNVSAPRVARRVSTLTPDAVQDNGRPRKDTVPESPFPAVVAADGDADGSISGWVVIAAVSALAVGLVIASLLLGAQ